MSWPTRIPLALGALLLASSAAHAATIPVTTTADGLANDGLCSLREAVSAARLDLAVLGCAAGSGDDLVQLEAGEYRLGAGGAGEDGNESGDLDTGPFSVLRIAGRGMNATVIGAAGDRVFHVFAGASLGLSDLTVRDGVVPEGASGGAVFSLGSLTALRVAFVNNAAGDGHTPTSAADQSSVGGGGGAIASQGQLQVADSVFSGNRAGDGSESRVFGATSFGARDGGDGGAILVTGGTGSLASVTVTGSRAGDGRADAPDTIFAGGSGGSGGGVAVTGGAVTVVNSTFQGNRAGAAGPPRFGATDDEAVPGSGGAVAAKAPGSLSVTFSTFAGNAPGTGPDGTVGLGSSVLGASVGGSVLADAGGACATPTPASIANVVLPGDTSCPGARIAGDPRLGALAANGGATPTMLPGPGSAAVNALVGVPCPGTDQRGLPRPALGACDAGAVEVQPSEPAAATAPRRGVTGLAARRVSSLSMSPSVFRAARSGASVGPAAKALQAKAPIGTTVRYRLDGAARVTFTITKPVPGRRKGRRCVRPAAAKPGAKRRAPPQRLKGSFAHTGAAGQNAFRFTGRLRGKALPPGRYTLVAKLPRPATGKAALARKAFRIVR